MRHHAPLTAILPSLSLATVFQAAAGRAWAKTRPTRAYHRVSLRTDGSASTTARTTYGDHDVGSERGEPSSSTTLYVFPNLCWCIRPPHPDASRTHCAASTSGTDAHLHPHPSLRLEPNIVLRPNFQDSHKTMPPVLSLPPAEPLDLATTPAEPLQRPRVSSARFSRFFELLPGRGWMSEKIRYWYPPD